MKYIVAYLLTALALKAQVGVLQYVNPGVPGVSQGEQLYISMLMINANTLAVSNALKNFETNASSLSNLIYSSSTSLSNVLLRGWYTNYTIHRPTDSITTISNRLRSNSTNWIHYFEAGNYPVVTTYGASSSTRDGTFVVKNARNFKIIGIGGVTFTVTNSMSPTGAVTSQFVQEPLFPGNVFMFEDFDGLELRDFNIVYQRTNYHGHCYGLPGDAIFYGGTNLLNYSFINLTIDGAPNQGIHAQTADYGTTRAWTNGLISNCRFIRIGSTNYNGGVGDVSNPTAVQDGTAVYVHKNTRVENCYFERNLRDIELEGTATNDLANTWHTIYTGFITRNKFVNYLDASLNLLTPSNICNVIISHNIFVHTNRASTGVTVASIKSNGKNLLITDNIFEGGAIACLTGIGSSTVAGDIIFQNNLSVSNLQVCSSSFSSSPGSLNLPSLHIENNKMLHTLNRSMYLDYLRNITVRNNYIYNGNLGNNSSVDLYIGLASATTVISNLVVTGNVFIKTNTYTRSAPIYINASLTNANIIFANNFCKDSAANTVSQDINDEVAPASTLTNRPTAPSQIYTNNVSENILNATLVLGSAGAASILVWERNFAAATTTLKKYGPYYNANAAEIWSPINIPLPPRAIFTISNETSIGAGPISVTNWAIIRR